MKTTDLILENRSGQKALYRLQPIIKYKRLREYADHGGGMYRLNSIGQNYYWAEGMMGGGNWYRGGFYVAPFIHDFCDVFIDPDGNAFKFIRLIK
jgi:hypothetical protein